ncbi:MAG: TolC family protein, partial [Candidatus Binatia bacterium]
MRKRKEWFLMRSGVWLSLLFPGVLAAQSSPLSLSDALSAALNGNPAIRNACDAVGGAGYEVDIAESEFGLRLSPQATSGLGSDTETSQSTIVSLSKKFTTGTTVELASGTSASEKSFYRSFSGVTVSQSLLRGFGPLLHTNNIVEAERGIATAGRQLELTKEQVVMDVIATFYRIIGQKLVLGVWERSFERAQQLQAASQAKMERGLTTKIDIFRAQTQSATAEASMLDAQESLQEAKDTLKILLGKELVEEIEVESQIIPAALAEGEPQLVETALQRRLDLQEAAEQVKDAERNARIAERSLFPDLRVGFNYSLTGRGNSFANSTG